MKKIKIAGAEYPCRVTMGAIIELKSETGKEVSELRSESPSDVLTFLWCCIRSACRVDGIAFDMTALEMADRMDMEEFARWQDATATPEAADGKKKATQG
jgi:hypothetical protein